MRIVNEEALVERCRRGDREAQRELYDRTADRIYCLLLRMTGNQDDAFDLAQEAYMRGLAQIDRFDGRSAVATWFYKIAVNQALQFLRRNKVMHRKLQELALDQGNGEDQTDVASVRLDVEAALAAIEPSERAILLLRYLSGLNYRAMADILGCAEGTVASRLSRARDRLREILRESYGLQDETDASVHPIGSA